VPLLARRFVDSIYTLVFIFDDIARLDQFYKAGWSAAHAWQTRLERRWDQEAKHQQWLADHRKWIDDHESDVELTADEKADPSKVPRWPNPGRMVKPTKDPNARAFLELLDEWHYGQLSQDAHLSYMGLARGAIVYDMHLGRNQHAYRERTVSAATVLYLALLSEVAIAAALPYERHRLRAVWQFVAPISDASDLWDARYDALL
jgi:hypothetical protein